LHIAKAALKTEELKKDERFPVLGVGLVLEPLTPELARELGPDIAEHCFTRTGKIRREMTRVQVKLRDKPQAISVRMAVDTTEPHCTLRNVRVPALTITKRGIAKDETEGRKTKKIAPQAETLRCTISCLVDPAEKVHREFFCSYINDFMLFSFEPEERDLFAEMRAESADDDDEDGDDDQPELQGHAPSPDADAGDVLEEQKKGGKRPRLKKAAKPNGASAEA
jgi:hypothetical protein